MGLGLLETIAVLVVGNAIGMSLFGMFVVIGQRTGVTGMVLSRAVFGRRGAYVPAAVQALLCIGWCAINTWIVLDLVMALLGRVGLVDPDLNNHAARIVVAGVIMSIQVAIAWFGYRVISAFERWTVPPTVVVLVAMTAVAWSGLDVDWGYAGDATLTGAQHVAAVTTVMTAIGIGWGITWLGYAGDYSRFVSQTVPARKLFAASALGQFIPVIWLGALGATLATLSSSSDPGEIIVDAYGVLAIPVLLLVVHGPLFALLGLEIARRHRPTAFVRGFEYRLTAPAFAGADVWVGGTPDGDRIDVAAGSDGAPESVRGSIELAT